MRLLLALLFLLYWSCSKPVPQPSFNEQAGFRVDSVYFDCKGKGSCSYSRYYQSTGLLTINFLGDWMNDEDESFQIYIYEPAAGRLKIDGNPNDSIGVWASCKARNGGFGYTFLCDSFSNPGYEVGTLEITKFDRVNRRLSAQFHFDVCDGNKIFRLREGKVMDVPIEVYP